MKNLILQLLIILFTDQTEVYSQDFTYDGSLGANHWGEQYNTCTGKHQSPINIDELKVQKKIYPPLSFNGFDQVENASLSNNGHTVVVSINFVDDATVSGGPLNSKYKFIQFHFHWGDNDTIGSEDRINNESYPVELHMVLYNEVYKDFNSALNYANGVVVLAFFYKLSDIGNANYVKFTNLLSSITEPQSRRNFDNPPKVKQLLSENLHMYYTYIGSLTTPPCSEVVTWLDFAVPIPISKEQIKHFRTLQGHSGPLTHNIRPLQPLNDRIIYENTYISDSDISEDNVSSQHIHKESHSNDNFEVMQTINASNLMNRYNIVKIVTIVKILWNFV